MTICRVRFEGPAALALHVATALADANGVELIASEQLSTHDDGSVALELTVEGLVDDVTEAVARLRDGMRAGASVEIVVG